MIEIRRLEPQELHIQRDDLASVLADCVAGGASVNFMPPFSLDDAARWWDSNLAGIQAGKGVIFGAFAGRKLVGTVQLGLDNPPNQLHRGEIRKMLVHRSHRGQGLARRLMAAAEGEARQRGLTLLTLDTGEGGEAETLYPKLGYQKLGIIPDYAKWPDGRPCDTVFFWKKL